jgi:hypothetical protein
MRRPPYQSPSFYLKQGLKEDVFLSLLVESTYRSGEATRTVNTKPKLEQINSAERHQPPPLKNWKVLHGK